MMVECDNKKIFWDFPTQILAKMNALIITQNECLLLHHYGLSYMHHWSHYHFVPSLSIYSVSNEQRHIHHCHLRHRCNVSFGWSMQPGHWPHSICHTVCQTA